MAIGAEELAGEDALGLAGLIARGEVSAAEVVDAAILRIEAGEPRWNAVTVRAFETARRAARAPLPPGPFAGVPYLAKDLHSSWAGIRSTNSLPAWGDDVAAADSTFAARVRAAGFVLLGKTNVPEWGWSLTTESPMHGPAVNPWGSALSPGGSSGGGAVAVSAGYLPLAEAGDGAGSTRAPAAIHGLVGLKPSRGRISPGPEAADFWHGGGQAFCLARTVRDAAAFMDAVQGGVPGEPYYRPVLGSCRAAVAEGGARLRIGVSTDNPRGDRNDPAVDGAVLDCARLAETLGHHVEPFAFRYPFEALWDAYFGMICVQTTRQLDERAAARGRPLREDEMSRTLWTTLREGRSRSGVRHAVEIERMRQLGRDVAALTSRFDAVLLPVLPQGTRPVGFYDMSLDVLDYNRGPMGEDNPYLMPFNASGQPALAIPHGAHRGGLPLGVQIVAPPGSDEAAFRLGAEIERASPWFGRRPPV